MAKYPDSTLVLEAQEDNTEVQRRVVHILYELQQDGFWGPEHAKRSAAVAAKAVDRFHQDKMILDWGLELLLRLGGLRHVEACHSVTLWRRVTKTCSSCHDHHMIIMI